MIGDSRNALLETVWRNFVSSSMERIEQAKTDRKAGPLREGAG